MGTVLKFSICEVDSCESFTVSENTGIYNATSNTTGFGAPNIAISDVTACTLEVTKPDSSTVVSINMYPTLPNTVDTKYTVTNAALGYGTADFTAGPYLLVYKVTVTYAITAVSQANKTFSVTGNKSGVFTAGDVITITGSTGNNGDYTVVSTSGTGPTVITVSQAIPSAVADGSLKFTETTSQYEFFNCAARCCVLDKLSEIDVDDCECLDTKLQLATRVFILNEAAKYAARCGKVNKSKKIVTYVANLCARKDCDVC